MFVKGYRRMHPADPENMNAEVIFIIKIQHNIALGNDWGQLFLYYIAELLWIKGF